MGFSSPSACLFIIIYLVACHGNVASGATYFFANNGVDTANCSSSAPCQSITKVNTLLKTTSPGDSYLFHRGDEFRGQINVANVGGSQTNSIVFSAYGDTSLPLPTIKGTEKVTGTWSQYKGHIYQISIDPSWGPVLNLFANVDLMTLAREPNGRDSFYRTGISTETLVNCTDLHQDSGFWNGATFRARISDWSYSTTEVVTHTKTDSGANLQVPYLFNTEDNFLGRSAGWGYYLENKLEILDTAGEWYFDNATHVLYFWPPNSDSPSNYVIEATVYSLGMQVLVNYVHVSNLNFQQQWNAGIYSQYKQLGLFVDSCKFSFQEFSGIRSDSYNITVQHSNFTNIYAHGIKMDWANVVNSLIYNNYFDSIGLIPGRGYAGTGGAEGIALGSHTYNVIIRGNRVTKTGYNGITFHGANHLLEYNIVDQALLTLADGGGLYLWGNFSWLTTVRHNFVWNVYSNALWTSHPNYPSAHCLYFDDYSHHLTAINNTLFSCYTSSLFVHDSHDNIIMNNILFNSTQNQLLFFEQFLFNITYNNTIANNFIYASLPGQKLISKNTNYDRTDFFGNFYTNTLCAPYNLNSGLSEYVTMPISLTTIYSAIDIAQFSYGRSSGNILCPFSSFPTVTPTDYTTPNLLVYGNMSLGNYSWSCYPTNCTATVGNYGLGNTNPWLEIASPPCCYPPYFITLGYSFVSFNFGTTTTPSGDQTNQYEISFNYYSPNGGRFMVVVRQNHDKYLSISESATLYATPGVPASAKIYVGALANDTGGRLDFQFPVSYGKLYVSQVSIRGVGAVPVPTNTSFVVGNPSSVSQAVNLPPSKYQYFDLAGNAVYSPVVLGPFGSLLLVQNGSYIVPVTTTGGSSGLATTGANTGTSTGTNTAVATTTHYESAASSVRFWLASNLFIACTVAYLLY